MFVVVMAVEFRLKKWNVGLGIAALLGALSRQLRAGGRRQRSLP